MKGMNHQSMGDSNRFLVLKSIVTSGPVSRVELSTRTGLSKMTITTLTDDFLEQGLIRECGTASSAAGRKPTLLEIIPDSLLTMGISVGRDMLQVGIVNLAGAVIMSSEVPVAQFSTSESFLDALEAMCRQTLARLAPREIWGVGVSSIGPINIQEGVILDPPDFSFGNIPVVTRLQSFLDVPVYIENDMAVAALAELYYGEGKNYANFVYLGVTAGIGGGVIINQRLYTGTNGMASILGHMIVKEDGNLCACGQRGCLEAMSSIRATVAWAKKNAADSSLGWMELLTKAKNGDSVCRAALERMCRYLTAGLVNIVNIYDPGCIFLGGDLWFAEDGLFEDLEHRVNSRMIASGKRPSIPVQRSHFPGNAYFGIAALVMENNLEYRRKPSGDRESRNDKG